jgi:membrane-associated protein
VTEFLQRLGEQVGGWLYLVAAGLAFAEAAILVGMVLPGETALLVAGYFCHEGVLDVRIMLPLAVAAAVGGDSVGYAFGRRFGPPLRASRLGGWVGEHRWDRVDGFLHRHGGKAVLLGRLTALLRALVPSMSGMARMRYRTFLIWNAAGGVLWAGACVWLGYAFAASLHTVERYATWAPLPLVVLVAVALVGNDIRRKRRERREQSGPAGDPGGPAGARGGPAGDQGGPVGDAPQPAPPGTRTITLEPAADPPAVPLHAALAEGEQG